MARLSTSPIWSRAMRFGSAHNRSRSSPALRRDASSIRDGGSALDFSLSDLTLSFDWFILALRIAFIFLVYFFLYQIARVTIRELVAIGNVTASASPATPILPDPSSAFEIIDPAESS